MTSLDVSKPDECHGSLPHATAFASSPAVGETLDRPLFQRSEEDEEAVMVEIPAGSWNFYQCYIEAESSNELKVRIPGMMLMLVARVSRASMLDIGALKQFRQRCIACCTNLGKISSDLYETRDVPACSKQQAQSRGEVRMAR
jgi:hypothetical protein